MPLPDLQKKKFLVDATITAARFPAMLQEQIEAEIGAPFFLYSNGDLLSADAEDNGETVADLYQRYKDEDGFWYVTYCQSQLTYPVEHVGGYKQRFSENCRKNTSAVALNQGKVPVICEVMDDAPVASRSVQVETKTAAERRAAWEEIKQRLPRRKTPEEKERRIELFKEMDQNGTDALSFREVYEGCVNILRLDEFTTRLYDIVKRAFAAAKGLGTDDRDAGDEDLVEFLEFRKMLCFIYDYFELTVMFDEIDTDGSMMIDRDEFRAAVPKIEEWGLTMSDPDAVFDQVDANGSGKMTFDEFCSWAAAMNLDADGEDNVE